jgi:hypothetical protein
MKSPTLLAKYHHDTLSKSLFQKKKEYIPYWEIEK